VLDDPLPDDAEIKGIIEGLVRNFRALEGFDTSPERIERATDQWSSAAGRWHRHGLVTPTVNSHDSLVNVW